VERRKIVKLVESKYENVHRFSNGFSSNRTTIDINYAPGFGFVRWGSPMKFILLIAYKHFSKELTAR